MKASSKSLYLRCLLALVFLLQVVPINTAQAATINDRVTGQQHITAPIAQTPPDSALPNTPRQLFLPLIGNGVSVSTGTSAAIWSDTPPVR